MSGNGGDDAALAGRLLDVIEGDILPLTEAGVQSRQQDLRCGDPAQIRSFAGAGRDQQRDRESALAWRGARAEAALRTAGGERGRTRRTACSWPRTSPARSASRPSPGPATTISTICSATPILRDTFAIPHDLRILKEVFGLEPGGYNASNLYWTSYAIPRLVAGLCGARPGDTQARSATLAAKYAALSRRYQESKAGNAIPLNPGPPGGGSRTARSRFGLPGPK